QFVINVAIVCAEKTTGGLLLPTEQARSYMENQVVRSRNRVYAPHWSATPLVYILRPVQKFIQQAQSGGIVLLIMTVLALLIANSPMGEGYEALLETHIGIQVGPWRLEESVLHWINDGLMVIFFFVV